jgi:hypothetical protein
MVVAVWRWIGRPVELSIKAKEFVTLSTKLFADMQVWIAGASQDDTLCESDLATWGRDEDPRTSDAP